MQLRLAELRESVENRPEFMVSLMAIDGASEPVANAIRGMLPVTLPASSFRIDLEALIITKLETRTSGSYIEVDAQLRLAISDERGKMLSFLTGGAKVQVKKASYNTAFLPDLRKEAIENAVRGMLDKLLGHLRRGAGA